MNRKISILFDLFFGQKKSIDKIIITTDIFRNSLTNIQSVSNNARWLYYLLSPIFNRQKIQSKLLLATVDGGDVDTVSIFNKLNISFDRSGWAFSTNTAELNLVSEYLQELVHADFVIGFGLTPAIIHLLSSNNVKFIDIEIAPYRLGALWYLNCRSNDKNIENLLRSIEIPHENHLQAACEFRGIQSLRYKFSHNYASHSSGLLIGQVPIDLAIVEQGKIRTLGDEDILEKIIKIAATFDILYLSPHPAMSGNISNLADIFYSIGNCILADSPSYAYLACNNISWVGGLSSSVLMEAELFDKNVERFVRPDRDYSLLLSKLISNWVCVSEEFFKDSFWNSIFSNKVELKKTIFPTNSNVIRRSLGVPALGSRGEYELIKNAPILNGETLYFTNCKSTDNLILFSGWSSPESWGTWSLGEYSSIAFGLNLTGEFKLIIEANIFNSPSVYVSINGSKEESIHFNRTNPVEKISFDLNSEKIGQLWFIRFRFDNTSIPAELSPDSTDYRTLALGIKTVLITQAIHILRKISQ